MADDSLKLANSVTFDRMERTLRHVRRIVAPETTSGPSYAVPNLSLINVLLGKEEPQWHDEVPAPFAKSDEGKEAGGVDNDIEWFGEALNDSQKEAISFCLKAQTVACIHGPPGVSVHFTQRRRWQEKANRRLVKHTPSSNLSSNSSQGPLLDNIPDRPEFSSRPRQI